MNQEERETEALRAELEYRKHPISLNPQILQNVFKETGLKPDWYVDLLHFWQKLILSVQQFSSLLWEWKIGLSFATSVLVAVVILFQVIPPEQEQEPRVKGSILIPQELVVSNPQETAQALKKALARLGIHASVKTLDLDEEWMVEVANLSTDNPDALFALLKEYKLKPPHPDENSLQVLVMAKDSE